MTEPLQPIRRAQPADAEAITRVHVLSWKTSYRGILPKETLDAIDFARRLAGWRKHLAGDEGVTLVAEDSGRVVGFCTALKNRDTSDRFPGEIGAIYLLEEAQRRGLGRALFVEATRCLKAQGLDGFIVWVLKQNQRARRFYEALGGQLLDERPIQIGDASYPEVSYGWEGSEAAPGSSRNTP